MNSYVHNIEVVFREITLTEKFDNGVKLALNSVLNLIAGKTYFKTFDKNAVTRAAEFRGKKVAYINLRRFPDTELDNGEISIGHNIQIVPLTDGERREFYPSHSYEFFSIALNICVCVALNKVRPVELSLIGKSNVSYSHAYYDHGKVNVLENKFEDYSNSDMIDGNPSGLSIKETRLDITW